MLIRVLARAALGLIPVLLVASGAAWTLAALTRRRGLSMHFHVRGDLISPGVVFNVVGRAVTAAVGCAVALFGRNFWSHVLGAVVGVSGLVGLSVGLFGLLYSSEKPESGPRAM